VKEEDDAHQADDEYLLEQLLDQRADRFLYEVGAVVRRDDLDARRQRRLDVSEFPFDAVYDVERVLAVAHHDDAADDFALAVELRDAPPHIRAVRYDAQVLYQDGDAALAGGDRDILYIFERRYVAPAADHVFLAAQLHDAAADVLVGAADGGHDLAERDAVGGELVGVDFDLVRLLEAAHARDLGDAGHGLEPILEVPILKRAEGSEVVLARFIHERVLEDPPHAGGVRAEGGRHAGGQLLAGLAEVLQDAAARPIHVGAVLEDDVDEGEAEEGVAADDLDARRRQHRRDERVRYLVLHQVRAAARPLGEDYDLDVGEVRDGVEGDARDGPDAPGHGERGEEHDDELVLGRELD